VKGAPKVKRTVFLVPIGWILKKVSLRQRVGQGFQIEKPVGLNVKK
jgi:hypothetical protein